DDSKASTKSNAKLDNFSDYISHICTLRSDIWKDKKINLNCSKLVEEELIGLGVGSDVCDLGVE
ncbi:MAG: hypothetical protein V4591_00700, partial [Bdellovibrionota bacterium]